MTRLADALLVLLLLVGLAEAAVLATRERALPRVAFSMTGPNPMPPGAASGDQVVRARVAALGDYLTIEDLARGVLAIERGELPGVAPFTEAERARLRELVRIADGHRRELLAAEDELRASEAELDELAREIAASLTPDQRAWVRVQRDRVSVGALEAAYWKALDEALAAPAGAP